MSTKSIFITLIFLTEGLICCADKNLSTPSCNESLERLEKAKQREKLVEENTLPQGKKHEMTKARVIECAIARIAAKYDGLV